jgi:7,8-dihydropterin-6-yl-methyl-4-(beta-D-ribofuranosyl)aminobenzene 5'-phosphate synthase
MKISVLAENSAGRTRCKDCLAEWGLSLYLEVDDVRILFDSGHKGTFVHNAKQLDVDLTTTAQPIEFSPGIYYLGEIPRQTDFEKGAYHDDPMPDDSAIAIQTDKGTIVVTGCSHAGVSNIAEYAKKVTGQKLYGVIGGFHLFEDDPAAIAGSVTYFQPEKPAFLLPMHCVDHAAMSELYRNFKVRKYGAGDVFEVET